MEPILYVGASPVREYSGDAVPNAALARQTMSKSYSIVVWAWELGIPPETFANNGLILLAARESLALYRFAAKQPFCRVLLRGKALAPEIASLLAQINAYRKMAACQTLFERYGSHLQIHLWYDLIVEGDYLELPEPGPYRLLLLHNHGREQIPEGKPGPHLADSRTILAEAFPEAAAILALQLHWEGVVLLGTALQPDQRVPLCVRQLSKLSGGEYTGFLSDALPPEALHDFYRHTVTQFRLRSETSENDTVAQIVCQYIDSHLGEKLTRKTLSENLFFSPDYLAKRFQAETGISMGTYICNARLSEAKTQLAQTLTPIGQIAAELGYRNFSEFSQWFRKLTGETPSEYRKLRHS